MNKDSEARHFHFLFELFNLAKTKCQLRKIQFPKYHYLLNDSFDKMTDIYTPAFVLTEEFMKAAVPYYCDINEELEVHDVFCREPSTISVRMSLRGEPEKRCTLLIFCSGKNVQDIKKCIFQEDRLEGAYPEFIPVASKEGISPVLLLNFPVVLAHYNMDGATNIFSNIDNVKGRTSIISREKMLKIMETFATKQDGEKFREYYEFLKQNASINSPNHS